MDYFAKNKTFNAQWPFIYAVTNSTCKKKKLLLITNTNKDSVDSVEEGTVSEPKFYFQYGQVEIQ